MLLFSEKARYFCEKARYFCGTLCKHNRNLRERGMRMAKYTGGSCAKWLVNAAACFLFCTAQGAWSGDRSDFVATYQGFFAQGAAEGHLTPDVIVSSAVSLRALLDSWQNNWSGTVPLGRTAVEERVVGVDFSSSTDIDLSNYDFSETSGHKRVTVRMVGEFSTSGSGNSTIVSAPHVFSGTLDLRRSRNMRLTLMQFDGAERIKVGGSEDITIERVYLKGYYGDWTRADGAPTGNFGFLIEKDQSLNTKRLIFRYNLVQGFKQAAIGLWGNLEDSVIEGNVLDIMSHDDFKLNVGPKKNIAHLRNWGSRTRSAAEGTKFHEDFIQWGKGGTSVEHWLSDGNVFFRGPWYGASTGVYQGFFSGDLEVRGAMFRNNIGVTNTYCIDLLSSSATDVAAFDNSFLAVSGARGNLNATINRAVTAYGKNLTTGPGPGNGKEGSGGVHITIGRDGAQFDAMLAYVSQVPTPDSMIEVLYPPPNSPHNWAYSGQRVGAWRRLKEIFVDGVHPENAGWPVAPIWHARWNANFTPLLPTMYTGRFDADGNNR